MMGLITWQLQNRMIAFLIWKVLDIVHKLDNIGDTKQPVKNVTVLIVNLF